MTKNIIYTVLLLLLFSGCSKELDEYNKPAAYWYGKMIESIGKGNLEKADNYYSSLQSEHIGSPLLQQATLIMAQAHMYHEEYLLSEHFLNEYIRRYADPIEREYAEYLKVKAKYLALPYPRRDQGLMNETIVAGETFKKSYPYSMYIPVVDTMITRLVMARAALNESIASLYDRLDKPKAARYYRNMRKEGWIDWNQVEPAQVPLYRSIFEGDGSASWYAFLIPDTQSVVSRNSLENGDADIIENKLQEQSSSSQDR